MNVLNAKRIQKSYPSFVPSLSFPATTGTNEYSECSRRGLCNNATGICDCFMGYVSSNGLGKPGMLWHQASYILRYHTIYFNVKLLYATLPSMCYENRRSRRLRTSCQSTSRREYIQHLADGHIRLSSHQSSDLFWKW